MEQCGGLPRKYFYLRAHSNVPEGLPRIPRVDNVTYINTIDPDSLCWHNKHTRRIVEIFASYKPIEREHNLQSFMRNLRFQSTIPELRGTMMYPSRSQDATNQLFAFYHESGEPLDSFPLGIWDMDELQDKVTSLNTSTILDRPTPLFFQELGFPSDSSKHILTLEQIRDMLLSRYPGRCIVIIMGGCRLIQTPERVAIRSREERRPDELPIDQLTEAFGHLRPPRESSVEPEEDDGATPRSADLFRHRPEIKREHSGMDWTIAYRGRDMDTDIVHGYDPLTRPAFSITSHPGRKREVSPPSSPEPKKRGGRKTRRGKSKRGKGKSKRGKGKSKRGKGKSKRGTRKGRKGKK